MKNLLLGIIAINLTFISIDTNAFEFKGVKSGMTREEVRATLGKALSQSPPREPRYGEKARRPIGSICSVRRCGTNEIETQTWLPMLFPEVQKANFYFDHNGKLYKLEIALTYKDGNFDPAAVNGYENAYLEFCDGVRRTSTVGMCWFQDERLYQDSLEHYKQIRLEALK